MKLGLIISFLFYFVTLMLMQNQRCSGCLEKERMALLEIKHCILSQQDELDSYINKELGSWVDDRDSNCCSWNRVKCSTISSGHITDLSLYVILSNEGSMLNVSLLRPFEELRLLDLSYNNIQGWIGNEGFPKLKKLETLDLSWNELDSHILPSLNGLIALRTLKLRFNLMNNSFSAQGFSRSKQLEILDLSRNELNCSIITSLHGFTSLKSLTLSGNEFNCSLSSLDFIKFSRLEILDLSSMWLSGTLHVEDVQSLRNLKILSLSDNYMEGSPEGCKGCLEKERIGLLKIKQYYILSNIGDIPYNNNELGSWVDDRDSNCCVWNRVKCSSGHITELSIQELLWSNDPKMLNVSLFCPFEKLRFLNLSHNNIQV